VLLPYTQRTVTERPGGVAGAIGASARSTRCRPRPRGSVPPPRAPSVDPALAIVEEAEADAEAGVVVEVVVEPR